MDEGSSCAILPATTCSALGHTFKVRKASLDTHDADPEAVSSVGRTPGRRGSPRRSAEFRLHEEGLPLEGITDPGIPQGLPGQLPRLSLPDAPNPAPPNLDPLCSPQCPQEVALEFPRVPPDLRALHPERAPERCPPPTRHYCDKYLSPVTHTSGALLESGSPQRNAGPYPPEAASPKTPLYTPLHARSSHPGTQTIRT